MARACVVVLAGATLGACYEPRVRDCALTCSAASECAGDQQCHGGWCVAPGASCESDGDGGVVTIDARSIDAEEPDDIDAAPTVELRIEVKGGGRVTTDQDDVSCEGPDGDCRFRITRGTEVVLTPVDGVDSFVRWRDACDGQDATCTLSLDANRRTKAEFE